MVAVSLTEVGHLASLAILDLPFIARRPGRVLRTSPYGDVTSKLTGDDWGRGCFSSTQKQKPNAIVTCARTFSRALHRLNVSASSFDWLVCVLRHWSVITIVWFYENQSKIPPNRYWFRFKKMLKELRRDILSHFFDGLNYGLSVVKTKNNGILRKKKTPKG